MVIKFVVLIACTKFYGNKADGRRENRFWMSQYNVLVFCLSKQLDKERKWNTYFFKQGNKHRHCESTRKQEKTKSKSDRYCKRETNILQYNRTTVDPLNLYPTVTKLTRKELALISKEKSTNLGQEEKRTDHLSNLLYQGIVKQLYDSNTNKTK